MRARIAEPPFQSASGLERYLSSARRFFAGMSVDGDALAFEAVRRAGPGGGFLMDEHTLRWMRTGEHYYSDLVNREGPDGEDMRARAHSRVLQLLAAHRPDVPEDVVGEIDRQVCERSKGRLRAVR